MKYHITSITTAQDISRQEAENRGCEGTTQYWYLWQVDPTNIDECALILPDDYSGELETVDALPHYYVEKPI